MELERILRSQGFGSRPECRAMVWRGRVSIQGAVCDDPFEDILPEGLVFSVDDVEWSWKESVYILLNKPPDFECSRKPVHHPSVYSLLPKPLIGRGVQAVGRLDEDTTGFLLFSDDGQFIHTYTSPKKKIPKVYEVILKHPIAENQVEALLSGVFIRGETEAISARTCVARGERELVMTITEGKYHLVKRMIAAVGNRVEGLKRVAVGGLTLPDDLKLGQWKWLDESELQRLALVASVE